MPHVRSYILCLALLVFQLSVFVQLMSVNRRLDEMSADVQSWSHLEAAACLPLSLFVQGFRDAVGSPV